MVAISSGARGGARASDRVEEDLRQRIVSLSLAPGAPLNDRELAAEYGCSRTPVLAALQRLAQDGLIHDIPRRGFFVTELTVAALADQMIAAIAFGGAIMPLAAENVTDAELEAMEVVLQRAEAAISAEDVVSEAQLNDEFHDAIYRSTHSQILADMGSRLQRLGTRFAYLGLQRPGDGETALAEHHAILDALRARDSEACRQRMLLHQQKGRERILAAL